MKRKSEKYLCLGMNSSVQSSLSVSLVKRSKTQYKNSRSAPILSQISQTTTMFKQWNHKHKTTEPWTSWWNESRAANSHINKLRVTRVGAEQHFNSHFRLKLFFLAYTPRTDCPIAWTSSWLRVSARLSLISMTSWRNWGSAVASVPSSSKTPRSSSWNRTCRLQRVEHYSNSTTASRQQS